MGYQVRALAVLAAAAGLAIISAAASAEVQNVKLKFVGTWHNLSNYKFLEKPFVDKHLPQASGGKVKGSIHPITELGLKGWEVMRLTKLGVFDAAFGSYGYVASENAALEGIDLSGVMTDYTQGREVLKAYEPVLRKTFDKTFNAHYMLSYPFPSQMVFCAPPVKKLTDLNEKRVRVYSTTLGDFVSALGGTSITIAFAEVVPALQKGVAQCGVTGSMPAYQARWTEVITHTLTTRVSLGMAFMAISNKRWNGFNDDTKAFLTEQARIQEDRMWDFTSKEDAEAIVCLSGKGKCTRGDPASVTIVPTSEEDKAELNRVLKESVLKNWAKRCSADCVADWNSTIGEVIGVKAE
ncbi:MAG: TRAP transporter substrate-binding protein [Alphaproteobacteria bacterium]|jgi:TRAP-type C4-dicarboxylate transport system substrate-binding protein|nr:TRAP transporter substrate-binding protein [Alphaproteobacteria bacterium]